MKHTITVLSCATALVAGLTACSGSGDKSTLPTYTGSPGPTATTTSAPTTTAPTKAGPAPLVEHASYNYDGMKFEVNLPADMPPESRASMIVFSEFLQGVGRTTAMNKLDSSLSDLASAQVVKETGDTVGKVSVQGIGSVSYTISKVQSVGSDYTLVTGCLDQSKLVQVRKDGSHFVDANTKRDPTLTMKADINRGPRGPRVTGFTFAVGSC